MKLKYETLREGKGFSPGLLKMTSYFYFHYFIIFCICSNFWSLQGELNRGRTSLPFLLLEGGQSMADWCEVCGPKLAVHVCNCRGPHLPISHS